MALSTEIVLESSEATLEVAVGLYEGKVNLKCCPHPTQEEGSPFRRIYSVLHTSEEEVCTLRLQRNSKNESVRYTVIDMHGHTRYQGSKFPPLGAVCRGVRGKLNRFLGKLVFRTDSTDMASWAKDVSRAMANDAARHARTMV